MANAHSDGLDIPSYSQYLRPRTVRDDGQSPEYGGLRVEYHSVFGAYQQDNAVPPADVFRSDRYN